jgi:hypothetical protein
MTRPLPLKSLPKPIPIHIQLHLPLSRGGIRKNDRGKKRRALIRGAKKDFTTRYIFEDGMLKQILFENRVPKTGCYNSSAGMPLHESIFARRKGELQFRDIPRHGESRKREIEEIGLRSLQFLVVKVNCFALSFPLVTRGLLRDCLQQIFDTMRSFGDLDLWQRLRKLCDDRQLR